MSDAQILVLGSEGAVGTHLVRMLHDFMPSTSVVRVSRSAVLDNQESVFDTMMVGDLLDSHFVESIFNKHKIQVVIFCAAKWNGLNQDPTVLDVNITMFNNVLSALTESVSNFIYLSSSAVYEELQISDLQEVDVLPSSTYGKSKLISEILLMNKAKIENISTIIYRPFHVVSPIEEYLPGRSHITTDFAHRYIELDSNFDWDSLPDDVFIPFYWVDDLCKIIVENIFNQEFYGKTFNIGASSSYSIIDLAKCVAVVASKYGLSSRRAPPIEERLVPIPNGMISQLHTTRAKGRDRDLMEIVDKFITEKYGLDYEC